jgi:hypothetical protein
MADEPTGGGNPNFWTTFKGRYTLVPAASATFDKDVVMLSCTNDVQIIGDCDLAAYTAGSAVATLPVECRPEKVVKVPVVVNDGTDRVVVMTVNIDGTMTLPFNYSAATLFLSGFNFNISDNWY